MTTLKLNTPVNHGLETITELVFQPLKAKHIRLLPSDVTMNYLLDLAGTLSGTTPKVMDELSAEDTFRILEVIQGFFPSSLKTGKTS